MYWCKKSVKRAFVRISKKKRVCEKLLEKGGLLEIRGKRMFDRNGWRNVAKSETKEKSISYV